MKKPNTKHGKAKLEPQTARLIRRSYGLRAHIARAGGFHRSYVTRILSGVKPPSARFLGALSLALEAMAYRASLEMVRMEHPQEFARAEVKYGRR